ncbi:MAG: tyrosine-type recombinase/integrase [Phyllobacterium sp.]|uniref:tyrosine-type recombinase/integrase n=1 Tax=Phyllobacterium sp. TaxID=1871046 RepID=UPI0030F17F5A
MNIDAHEKKNKPGTVWNCPKVPGLRLRHMTTKSVYYLSYRTRTTRVQRNMKLADQRVITLTAVRDMAKAILVRVAHGEDPAWQKKELAKRPTMALLKEHHLTKHADTKNKSSWAEDVGAYYDNHVIPHFGADKVIADVTEAEINELHWRMRKTPSAANRCMSMLKKAFSLSEKWGWRPRNSNPVQIDRYKEVKRKRLPSADEAVRLLVAINNMRADNPWFAGLIELLCFTGARKEEIMSSKWAWIRDDGLHLPDSKTGEKVVALSREARKVLKTIPRVKANPYIIPGHIKGKHLVNSAKPWATLLKAANVEGLRMHDLRRFFASAGLSSGLNLSTVGELLGHMEASTTKRYAFLLAGESQKAADIASERVRAIMTNGVT